MICRIHTWIRDLRPLRREDQSKCVGLDKVSGRGQPCAPIIIRLGGSSGISSSFGQWFMKRFLSLESWMMPIGMQRIIFWLTSKTSSEDRHHKALGIAPFSKLQPPRSSSFKQHPKLLKFPGNFWSFQQLRTNRVQRHLKLPMLFGRVSRFSQLLSSNQWRLFRRSVGDDNSIITISIV